MKRKVDSLLGPLALPVQLAAVLAGVFLVGRVFDSLLFESRIALASDQVKLLLIGMRIDLATVCYQTLPLLVVLFCLPKRLVTRLRYPIAVYALFMAGLSLFLEIATPSFMNEFGLRPNQLMLEHLREPKEILQTVFANHALEVLGLVVSMGLAGRWMWRASLRTLADYQPWPVKRTLAAAPVILLLAVLGARGKMFKGAPMGLDVAEFSNNSLENQLALNSTFSLGHALTQLRFEADPRSVYRLDMADADALERVKRLSGIAAADFLEDPENPLLHRQRPRVALKRPRNLVIVLEESLGAEYVGSLGGLPLTPHIDALSKQGVQFTRLYSTGTRSARGIEAVLAGFLPSPSESTIKLGKAQFDFFTLAKLLRASGYHTSFLYGGDSNFDNMRTFALNNGFEEIIDQRDFDKPVFKGVWGVSDEDLLQRADRHFNEHSAKPFFTLMFTTSNHAPFGYPKGRIIPYEKPDATVHNTVKYADYALGQFFKLASERPYFKDTVFLIVADHNYRNFGSDLVPVSKMRIPGIILAPGLKPRVYDKPASQIDLGPTVLALLGLELKHPMIGQDVLARPKDHPGRAIMQFGNNNAYMLGDRVVVLQPRKGIKQFVYKDERLKAVPQDPELVQDAIAHALLPGYLYKERKYH